MKTLFVLACVTVVLFLASPIVVEAQKGSAGKPDKAPNGLPRQASEAQKPTSPQKSPSSASPEMSPEKIFDYFVATYYNGGGLMANLINLYGKLFEAKKYDRAMADKYERERYIAQIVKS